ncbi:hypothetical protein ACWCPF_33775 [Streptomyces sp. NPDC001858]
MPRTRHLSDPATGRTWTSHCADGVVETVAGSPGRERRTRKEGAGPQDAVKQEWARLRKGFLLSDPTAAPGEPVMHRYLGPAYTGAMVAEAVEGRLLCNRFDDTDKRDRLFLVDEDGGLADSVSLPAGRLAWQARPILQGRGECPLPRSGPGAAGSQSGRCGVLVQDAEGGRGQVAVTGSR